MTVKEVRERLESYAKECGDNVPVCTFDLDRWLCNVSEVELCKNKDGEIYIYIGS